MALGPARSALLLLLLLLFIIAIIVVVVVIIIVITISIILIIMDNPIDSHHSHSQREVYPGPRSAGLEFINQM